ncbi:hypothetical protein HPB50_027770 [Hyalomma asiaticum]|nr:hypothetical protein HPB50_027770 [Hyalomma asiaticum]
MEADQATTNAAARTGSTRGQLSSIVSGAHSAYPTQASMDRAVEQRLGPSPHFLQARVILDHDFYATRRPGEVSRGGSGGQAEAQAARAEAAALREHIAKLEAQISTLATGLPTPNIPTPNASQPPPPNPPTAPDLPNHLNPDIYANSLELVADAELPQPSSQCITPDPRHSISLIWTLAHAGLPGNEEAHSLARGLPFRAGEIEPPSQAEERLLSFSALLAYYRDQRRVYAPPVSSLTITQPAHWRRLQIRTAPYPILLNAQYSDQFPSSCKLRGKPGDFLHIPLTCPTFLHPPSLSVAVFYWECIMNSTPAFDQRKVISCAMKRIALQGLSFAL